MSLVHQTFPTKNGNGTEERGRVLYHPEVVLSGHEGPVLSAKFNDKLIVSGSQDKTINVWKLPTEEDANLGCITTNSAVVCVAWMDENIVSSGSDSHLSLWDGTTGQKIRKFNNGSIANEIVSNGNSICSGDDNGDVKVWDSRTKDSIKTITTKFPILTVQQKDNTVYFSGIDPTIHAYDIRNIEKPLWETVSTMDSITSIALNTEGSMLVSRTAHGKISTHNTKVLPDHVARSSPYIYDGAPSKEGNLIRTCFSRENARILSGSDDSTVTMWDVTSRRILSKFAGHEGPVIDVGFHGTQNIILSTSIDGTIIVREV